MNRLKPEKLHITLLVVTNPEKLVLPRRYTLTHSDITGELFLSIGSEYNLKQISRLYTRLMRDEVIAELLNNGESFVFRVYCHVSGGFVIGTAGWRYNIFRSELPLALEALRYGDRALFEHNSELDNAAVHIHMESNIKRFKKVENWGTMSNYR
jgi:hypothetical protein